ncbi:hypothetical protein H696_01856 [Fonticula alba]|uniref:ENTH domain-containing protein n=1 Tax=Fonticula alba TaxID=691883 RepID=A0A058Z9G3_FONAL|nr:hypothetical protein H696_01856 [Fonticula alba]KCV70910.1 hypothetical protein H696_01856 [Fonticula alba]|eukprot:XP_009494033.1 hypothetical protein H696_01856 [Fonticula alba]
MSNLLLSGKKLMQAAENFVMNYPPIVAKVREATSNEAWGSSSTLNHEIAQATHNYADFPQIMDAAFGRLLEVDKWRVVYKALLLIEFLIYNGSSRVVDVARERQYEILSLQHFSDAVDEKGRDVSINVRTRAKQIHDLLQNKDAIVQGRLTARQNRDKYKGLSSNEGGQYGGFGSSGGGSSYRSAGGDSYGNDSFSSFGSSSAGGYAPQPAAPVASSAEPVRPMMVAPSSSAFTGGAYTPPASVAATETSPAPVAFTPAVQIKMRPAAAGAGGAPANDGFGDFGDFGAPSGDGFGDFGAPTSAPAPAPVAAPAPAPAAATADLLGFDSFSAPASAPAAAPTSNTGSSSGFGAFGDFGDFSTPAAPTTPARVAPGPAKPQTNVLDLFSDFSFEQPAGGPAAAGSSLAALPVTPAAHVAPSSTASSSGSTASSGPGAAVRSPDWVDSRLVNLDNLRSPSASGAGGNAGNAAKHTPMNQMASSAPAPAMGAMSPMGGSYYGNLGGASMSASPAPAGRAPAAAPSAASAPGTGLNQSFDWAF